MAETKATQKELFARIMEAMADDPQVVELCEKNIERLSRPRKKKVTEEMMNLGAEVTTYMSEAEKGAEFTNKMLVTWYNEDKDEEERVSSQKMAAVMRYLVGTGAVSKIVGERPSDPTMYKLVY